MGDIDPKDILAEYLAEHAYWSTFESDTMTLDIQFGIPERVPELPAVAEHVCAFCNTRISKRDGVGWVHEESFNKRGFCTVVWPITSGAQ